MIKPFIAFLPSLGPLTPELFAKEFTNEGMRIQVPGIVWIFPSKQPCSS
jgi:hypothetical protein